MPKQSELPLSLKIAFVVFMAFYFPAYWLGYGLQNFLWFSSVILILAFIATLLESRFLASMAVVGGLVMESLWVLDFLFTLSAITFGSTITGFTEYMFDPELSIVLRILALFHVALPPLFIYLIIRLGYDRRAFPTQLVLTWIILLITWLTTSPALNINFVFGYLKYPHLNMAAGLFLLLLALSAVVVEWGTHLFLRVLSSRYSR